MQFQNENNLPGGALLILDNAPSHPVEEELVGDNGNIRVCYMPPNVTPLIQPMDQNAINITKLHYKNLIMTKILSENDKSVDQIIKELTIKDAVIFLAAAWNKLKESTIKNCWSKILDFSKNYEHQSNETDYEFDSDSEIDIPLSILKTRLQVNEEYDDLVGETIAYLDEIAGNQV